MSSDKPVRLTPKGRPKTLTNRDYFAGIAAGFFLQANHAIWDAQRIKKEAYLWADLMIAEQGDCE